MNSNLRLLLRELGFKGVREFREYMKGKARLNEYGAVCYTENREGYELNYSDNCKHVFGIGGNVKGIFTDYRFN